MTETADGGDSVHPLETSEAQAYFRAVESAFLELRGAPLLLSPADWRVARRWFEEGVPLELVGQTLKELVTNRRERDPDARISSLRYFDRAVRAAWKQWQDARGPAFGRPRQGEEPSVAERLEALAAELPADLPERSRWSGRIRSLSGSPREVEEALERLDEELYARLRESLGPTERAAIQDVVDRAVSRAGDQAQDVELPQSLVGLAQVSTQGLGDRALLPVQRAGQPAP